MAKKVMFSPIGSLINIAGFGLGLFFADTIIPIGKALYDQILGSGTPTTNILGPILVNGTLGGLTILILVLMALFFLKKFTAFIMCIIFGMIVFIVLTEFIGITIPDPGSLIGGVRATAGW